MSANIKNAIETLVKDSKPMFCTFASTIIKNNFDEASTLEEFYEIDYEKYIKVIIEDPKSKITDKRKKEIINRFSLKSSKLKNDGTKETNDDNNEPNVENNKSEIQHTNLVKTIAEKYENKSNENSSNESLPTSSMDSHLQSVNINDKVDFFDKSEKNNDETKNK